MWWGLRSWYSWNRRHWCPSASPGRRGGSRWWCWEPSWNIRDEKQHVWIRDSCKWKNHQIIMQLSWYPALIMLKLLWETIASLFSQTELSLVCLVRVTLHSYTTARRLPDQHSLTDTCKRHIHKDHSMYDMFCPVSNKPRRCFLLLLLRASVWIHRRTNIEIFDQTLVCWVRHTSSVWLCLKYYESYIILTGCFSTNVTTRNNFRNNKD